MDKKTADKHHAASHAVHEEEQFELDKEKLNDVAGGGEFSQWDTYRQVYNRKRVTLADTYRP